MRSLYDELELSASASADDIRRAYRRLARACHPDAVAPQASAHELQHREATRRFQRLSEAHDTLIDPLRRQAYDAHLQQLTTYEQLRRATRQRVDSTSPDAVVAQAMRAAQAARTVRARRRRESLRQRYGGVLIVAGIALVFWLSLWTMSRVLIEPAPVMDLSYRGIRQWPEALSNPASNADLVERLNLRHNDLQTLPPEVVQLGSLILLDVSYNQLSAVPAELGGLPWLAGLHLEGNTLREVPASLGALPRLRMLNLAHNRLHHVPPELFTPRDLRIVDLTGNPIAPTEVERLRRRYPKIEIRF